MAARFAAFVPRMAVVGLVWLFATGTLTYAAGEKLTAKPTAPTPSVQARPTLIVPDIRGQAFVFAKGILEDGGFGWRVVGGVQGYPTNVVVSQRPAPGTRVQDTGSPTLTLTLRHGTYRQDGQPENTSPYPGTSVLLARSSTAPKKLPAVAKPKKKAHTPAKRVHAAAKPKHTATKARPPAFVVPGARKEPLDEIPLTERAQNLGAWFAHGRKATNANVRYWAYQHAWIVTGARFGWWHGAQALQTLILVDKRVEARWGIGHRSEAVARAALAYVEEKSRRS
jgi:hypothetical protein